MSMGVGSLGTFSIGSRESLVTIQTLDVSFSTWLDQTFSLDSVVYEGKFEALQGINSNFGGFSWLDSITNKVFDYRGNLDTLVIVPVEGKAWLMTLLNSNNSVGRGYLDSLAKIQATNFRSGISSKIGIESGVDRGQFDSKIGMFSDSRGRLEQLLGIESWNKGAIEWEGEVLVATFGRTWFETLARLSEDLHKIGIDSKSIIEEVSAGRANLETKLRTTYSNRSHINTIMGIEGFNKAQLEQLMGIDFTTKAWLQSGGTTLLVLDSKIWIDVKHKPLSGSMVGYIDSLNSVPSLIANRGYIDTLALSENKGRINLDSTLRSEFEARMQLDYLLKMEHDPIVLMEFLHGIGFYTWGPISWNGNRPFVQEGVFRIVTGSPGQSWTFRLAEDEEL